MLNSFPLNACSHVETDERAARRSDHLMEENSDSDGFTQTHASNGVFSSESQPNGAGSHGHLTRTLVWVGIAGLSAALAFTVLRALLNRQPVDPTSRRIQQLIDEANQLLRTLDEQKNTAE